MSSEDYQNELNNVEKEQDTSVKLEDFVVPDENNGIDFDEKINSEIPVDVDTMGVVIDKAPSLSTDDLPQDASEISENDINDLMADLMSSLDTEKKSRLGVDEETIEAGRALEEYLNSPVEQLINHPEMTASLGLEVPSLESLDSLQSAEDNAADYMDFPSMPQIPDIPEVVERDFSDSNSNNSNEVTEADAFGGFNLDPITIDNFDERFENEDAPVQKLVFDDFNSGSLSLDEMTSNDGMQNDAALVQDDVMSDNELDATPSEFAELDALLSDILPAEDTEGVSLEDMASLDDMTSLDEMASLEEMASLDDVKSLGDMASLDEMASLDDMTSLDEMASLEEMAPLDEIKSLEEMASGEEATVGSGIDFTSESEAGLNVETESEADLNIDLPNELVTEVSTEPDIASASSDEVLTDLNNETVDSTDLDNETADSTDLIDEAVTSIEVNEESGDDINNDLPDGSADVLSEAELEDMRKELAESIDDEDDAPGEDDIEKLLANAQREASMPEEDNRENMSLEELLQTSNDGKAEDIGDMLDKAERNEAVDEGISALLNSEELPPVDIDSLSDSADAELDPKAAKKAEKLRLKEEKKEAKRKAKEAKAAAKLAKKNAKNGVEPLQKLSFDTPGAEDEGPGMPEIPSADAIVDSGLEHNTDMSDIEALLAGADSMGDSSSDTATDKSAEVDVFGDTGDLFGQTSDSDVPEVESSNGESLEDIPEKGAKDGKTNPIKAFFDKIVNFLTEEDEEASEKSEIILSDENAAILDELNGEELPEKKKKKKGKNDKKQSSGNEDNPEDLPEKKPAKKKKEKKPKKAAEEGKPEPKISTKKIAMVSLVCIMLGVAIFLVTYFTADYTVKMAGRDAFLNEDYQTCYQNFYGKKMNESEQVMFNRSECILKIQIWLREYELYASEDNEVKALDSLIQSINSYPALKATSEEWGCLDKVEPVYNNMLDIADSKYALSEEQALEIAALEDDVIYTRIVNAVAKGVLYEDALNYVYTDDISGNTPIEEVVIPANMDDMLPEEDGMTGESFIEP